MLICSLNGLHHWHANFVFPVKNWTKVLFSSLSDISIPLTLRSCSDSASNKQFPDTSLSETMNPLSEAIFLGSDDGLVLFLTWIVSDSKSC